MKENVNIGPTSFNFRDFQRINIFDFHLLQWRPIPFGQNNPSGFDVEVFTDGLKMGSRVGSSVVVYYHGQEIYHEECCISDHASVFHAEIQGIGKALNFIQKMGSWDRVRIFSDSFSLLQALAAVKNSDPRSGS
ncbi:hypothetical protein AVEN_78604-1 [Araneus ventricosus]|uniref:Uncharacterized protein n=1 Tax=Araneus ventricosus TaxID=182803 RepID=A0A4Y2FY52_ARAVE|nr:hypothetical protein AVEN_78604-1 [Araneus ventricosus]